MKKTAFLAILAIVAIAAITFSATSCKKSIDPVHGTQAVTNAFYTDADENQNFPLDRFHELGQAGDTAAQRALVDQYRKQLTANVVREYPQIKDEKNIHFVLGSGFARNVKSGDGKLYSGKFQNELIIIINDPTVKDTVFLACGNGMLSPLDFSDRHNFGQGDPWLEIEPNDSYAKFFPENWGELAKDADIGIRNEKGEMVPPRVYQRYLGKYTSMLRPGDKINIITGEVRNGKWEVVNFSTRQHDTEVANAANANKTKQKQQKKSTAPSKGKRRK